MQQARFIESLTRLVEIVSKIQHIWFKPYMTRYHQAMCMTPNHLFFFKKQMAACMKARKPKGCMTTALALHVG